MFGKIICIITMTRFHWVLACGGTKLILEFILFVEVFPQPFEGCKLVINKGLSNHFQVSHTLQLSGTGPGAYHFGATYVGNKQTGPNEVGSFAY